MQIAAALAREHPDSNPGLDAAARTLRPRELADFGSSPRPAEPVIAEELRRQEKQVIFVWLDGGMSQLESWDPKPNTDTGGPFKAIPTSVPDSARPRRGTP